jgi:hypothetical protein
MKLPQVDQPERYRGLYVFDFGAWSAVGYTAEEIALLLESEAYRDGRIYKIHRAAPDGTFELRGVARERFSFESGLLFHRHEPAAAAADYRTLAAVAEQSPPPCRAVLHLARLPAGEAADTHATVLIFPAEYEDEMAAWLTRIGFEGGDLVEGGISHVTNYYELRADVLERRQLWSRPTQSRCRQEVYDSVRRAVQR